MDHCSPFFVVIVMIHLRLFSKCPPPFPVCPRCVIATTVGHPLSISAVVVRMHLIVVSLFCCVLRLFVCPLGFTLWFGCASFLRIGHYTRVFGNPDNPVITIIIIIIIIAWAAVSQ